MDLLFSLVFGFLFIKKTVKTKNWLSNLVILFNTKKNYLKKKNTELTQINLLSLFKMLISGVKYCRFLFLTTEFHSCSNLYHKVLVFRLN